MTTVFDQFIKFVEDLFVTHAKDVVAVANSPTGQAIEQAAASAAVETAVQDPKVQAGIAVFQAVKNYNAIAQAQAAPTPAPPVSPVA